MNAKEASIITWPQRWSFLFSLFVLRPKIEHPSLFCCRDDLLHDRRMRRRLGVGLESRWIIEREHKTIRESFVVRFWAVILPPLERLNRFALRWQLGDRFLDALNLLRRRALLKLQKQ